MIAARREYSSCPRAWGLMEHARPSVLVCTSDSGSIDPEQNIALFNVLKRARASGVPKANIESALQKVRAFVLYFSYEKKNGIRGLTWISTLPLFLFGGVYFDSRLRAQGKKEPDS